MATTTRPVRTGLLAAACLALALPAAAQGDRDPIITSVKDGNRQRTTKAPQGGVLVLAGRNLYKLPELAEGQDPAELPKLHEVIDIKIGGKKAQVLDSNWDEVWMMIPVQCPTGRQRITLEIKGRKKAQTEVVVVDQKQWQEQEADRGVESGIGNERQKEEEFLKTFQITRFELLRQAAGNSFVVEGRAKGIPDRLFVALSLRFNDRPIRSARANISKEVFRATFGPYKEKLLYGPYSVELTFRLDRQPRARARKFVRSLSEGDRERYQMIIRRQYTQVGSGPGAIATPEDKARQLEQLQANTLELTRGTKQLLEEMRGAYACAARSFFKQAGQSNYSEQKYKDWLQAKGYAANADQLAKIVADKRFATRSGHFKPQEFQEWAEKTFLGKLRDLERRHIEYHGQFLCPLDPHAKELGDWLVAIVSKLFVKQATSLYLKSQLQVPASLKAPIENPVEAPQISVPFFEAKRRELLKQVDLNQFVEGGTQ